METFDRYHENDSSYLISVLVDVENLAKKVESQMEEI